MKKLAILVALLGTCFTLFAQPGCTEGPYLGQNTDPNDCYGYSWQADSVSGAPAFGWFDITATGTQVVGLADDNFSAPISIGFDFPYYFNTYNQLFIGSNGYVMFEKGTNVASTGIGFPTFPTGGGPQTPNNFIGAWTSDLTLTDATGAAIAGAAVYYEEVEDDSIFVVSFINVPYWSNDNAQEFQGQNTFQIVLYASGNFKLQYQSISTNIASSYVGVNFATRGFENATGQFGTCLPSNTFPDNNSAIFVTRPGTTPCASTDLALQWVVSPSNSATVVTTEANVDQVDVQVRNVGTQLVGPTEVTATVFNVLDLTQVVVRDTQFTGQLAPDASTTLTFDLGLSSSAPQMYSINVQMAPIGDANASNNTNRSELTIIQKGTEPDSSYYVGYDRFVMHDHYGYPLASQAAPGAVSVQDWGSGADDGSLGGLRSGVYVEPAEYPAVFTEVSLSMLYEFIPVGSLLSYQDVTVEVYDGSAGPPNPGALIGSVTLSAGDFTLPESFIFSSTPPAFDFAVQRVDFPDTEIAAGGVFISVNIADAPDDTLRNFVLTDGDAQSPPSFRTYEITAGQWAPYREAFNIDFAIRGAFKNDGTSSRSDREVLGFWLNPAFPNPTVDAINLPYELDRAGNVSVEVRDALGRLVVRQALGSQRPGLHAATVSTAAYTNGIYTYILDVDGRRSGSKFVVQR